MFLKQLSLIISILFCLTVSARAQSVVSEDKVQLQPAGLSSLKAFEALPVLHEGRIKPVDTYARNLVLQFSGKYNVEGQPAVAWLAKLLFAPEHAQNDRVFLINHPDVVTALGIEPQRKRRYSFVDILLGVQKLSELAQAASAIEDKERSLVEQEILRLYENVNVYVQHTNVFSFSFPNSSFRLNDAEKARELGLSGAPVYRFIDIALKADVLNATISHLQDKPQGSWTQSEREIFQIVAQLFHWTMTNQGLPMALIPSVAKTDEQWLSPWDMVADFQVPEVREELKALAKMVDGYWAGEQLAFDIAAKTFKQSIAGRISQGEQQALSRIALEVAYNKLQPFLVAKLCYIIAFILFLISFFPLSWNVRAIAVGVLWAGFLPHAIAIVARIIILQRPPVSSLYETFIFVAFLAVLIGLIIEKVNKKWLGIVVASVSGFAFLMIAGKFASEGDTLKMLVAVLNSNFWLSTHVLSITMGYAGCSVAALVGHVYLVQRLMRPQDKEQQLSIYNNLMGTLGFGLMMTFLGTTLGGIWADQSWGRFWGWDPKENGALMIVLWTALIFHARLAKIIGPVGVAVCSVLGGMVVAWAWFGVNLLSIGLHSYGFTSGIAYSLLIYYVAEIVFVAVSLFIIKKTKTT